MKSSLSIRSALVVTLPLLAAGAASCKSAHSSTNVIEDPAPTGLPTQPGPQPDFGPLVKQADPPPPISGGTLALAPDGTTAVASDPDRDRVYIVDLPTRTVAHTVQLAPHSEPGRVAIDDQSRAYVVLRHSGEIATIDLATGGLSLQHVCAAPRGVAFQKDKGLVHVACASGELISIALDGSGTSSQDLGRDLRDVVDLGHGQLDVTRFRAAEVVQLQDGATSSTPIEGANVAWRAVALPPTDGTDTGNREAAVVSQEPSPQPVSPTPGGYGGSSASGLTEGECAATGIVATKVSLLGSGSVRLPEAVLPVDLATNGREMVVVAAGNAFTKELPQLFILSVDALRVGSGDCAPAIHGNVPGQAIAAAFDGSDELVVQTREPAAIHIMTEDRRRVWKTITLATDSRQDTGHAIFHSNAGGFIACASCHAEGRDDGHVWEFIGQGQRRTPSLLGTIQGTAPYHWDGEMADMRALVDHVFVERMSGPKIDDDHLGVLQSWLFALPEPNKLREPNAATARGADLFAQRCTACHSGERLTNNQSVDVGTGGKFQVPSLIGVGWRAPFLHTGCATTLFDRFDPTCGGAQHAVTSDLSPDQIQDLVQFLETL